MSMFICPYDITTFVEYSECAILSLTQFILLQNMKNEEMSTVVSMNLVSCVLHTVADSQFACLVGNSRLRTKTESWDKTWSQSLFTVFLSLFLLQNESNIF